MDSEQIRRALRRDPKTKKVFRNVYASDALPSRIRNYPTALIVNTDTSAESGTHWLAIYLHDNLTAEFFDSFGRHPSNFQKGNITKFLRRYQRLTYNDVALQSADTQVCGYYVIYYVYCKCMGESMNSIVSRFNVNNDLRVFNFVRKYFSF